MTINQILEESGMQIAALLDPTPHATEVQWFFRTSMESLAVFGRIKESGCGTKISVEKSNDDFTSLSITVEAKYDVSFRTLILTKTLTTEVLLDYVLAGMLIVTKDMEEYGLVD
jgi:hypothetical protein